MFIEKWSVKLLLTDKIHQLSSFPFLASPDQDIWRAVTFDLGIPYTFVNFAREIGGVWLSQVTALWRQEDVLTMCRNMRTDVKCRILDIWLLHPCATDERKSWKWVPVSQIFSGYVLHSPTAWPFYVTIDGETLQGGGDCKAVEISDEWEAIYSASQ